MDIPSSPAIAVVAVVVSSTPPPPSTATPVVMKPAFLFALAGRSSLRLNTQVDQGREGAKREGDSLSGGLESGRDQAML